jgi:hypothetical protein
MPISDTLKTVFIGGFGGCLPTLCGLAATAVSQPTTPVSIPLQGLSIFFLIGAVVAYSMVVDKKDVKAILFAGVTAPAIIAGINSGKIKDINATQTTSPPVTVQTPPPTNGTTP